MGQLSGSPISQAEVYVNCNTSVTFMLFRQKLFFSYLYMETQKFAAIRRTAFLVSVKIASSTFWNLILLRDQAKVCERWSRVVYDFLCFVHQQLRGGGKPLFLETKQQDFTTEMLVCLLIYLVKIEPLELGDKMSMTTLQQSVHYSCSFS